MVFDAQAVADRLDVAQRVDAASPPLVKWARSAGSLPALAGNLPQLKTRRLAGSGIEAGVIGPCPREHRGL